MRHTSQFGQPLIGRPRSRGRPKFIVIPTKTRRGRLMIQARRGLIANDGLATTTQLLAWAYPRDRKHWHCNELRRSLRQLGVKEVGRAQARGRPIIWSLSV